MMPPPGFAVAESLHQDQQSLVYRATRRHDGGSVLIKTMIGQPPTPQAIVSLRHEYDLLRNPDHPGVPKALDTVLDVAIALC